MLNSVSFSLHVLISTWSEKGDGLSCVRLQYWMLGDVSCRLFHHTSLCWPSWWWSWRITRRSLDIYICLWLYNIKLFDISVLQLNNQLVNSSLFFFYVWGIIVDLWSHIFPVSESSSSMLLQCHSHSSY